VVGIGTKMLVVDNLGGRRAICFNILGSFSFFARLGCKIIIAIKDAMPRKKVKRHEVRLSVLVRARNRTFRINGVSFFSLSNACVVLDRKRGPIFTRIKGSVPLELRQTKFVRFMSLASGIY
jgi:large subunit ribosomal protein L14